METVEVDGLRVAYHRDGHGPPLVLLHGYVGDGLTCWQPQLDVLSDEFTVVAWDAPGAGGSDDPPDGFGMAGYANCMAGFIEALGLGHPHIGGLSFGGALAIAFAHLHPSVPSSLVLVSAYAGWRGSLAAEVAEQRLKQAFALAELSPDDFVDTLLPTMFAVDVTPQAATAFEASMRTFHPSGFREMARASAEDLRETLPHIDAPTLLIYGDNDVRAPLEVAHRLHSAIDGSELVVLPGVGHVCSIEAPDPVNAAMRRFLSR